MTHTFKASLKAINEALKRGEITLDTSRLVMIDELAEFTREDQAALNEWKAKPQTPYTSFCIYSQPQ